QRWRGPPCPVFFQIGIHGDAGGRLYRRLHSLLPVYKNRPLLIDGMVGQLSIGRSVMRFCATKAFCYCPLPSSLSTNAYISAASSSAARRPDTPPWPAAICVFSSRRLSLVLSSRNFTTHFAGSQ